LSADEFGHYGARTDCVDGNAGRRDLHPSNFGQSDDAVFRRDVRRFERRTDHALSARNTDDAAAPARNEMRPDGLGRLA
jgi:hypothetical protein